MNLPVFVFSRQALPDLIRPKKASEEGVVEVAAEVRRQVGLEEQIVQVVVEEVVKVDLKLKTKEHLQFQMRARKAVEVGSFPQIQVTMVEIH